MPPLHTPDKRYLVVRGRLWRCSNPALAADARAALVQALMAARRDIHTNRSDADKVRAARARVQAAKVALGERGAVWWHDGAPDYNRYMVHNTPYRDWYQAQQQL